MPGQATVTINEVQWSVSVASTYAELTKGLGGVPSIPASTGMLFVLPAEQTVSVTTQSMQFNLDIIFISSDLKVVDVARNVAPGYVITESTPVRYFLEINAGEAAEVEVGDTVEIEQLATIQDNITPVMAFAIPLVALGFVCSLAGGMARVMMGSSHSSHHSLQEPSEKARRCARCGKYKDVKYRSGTGLWLCDECFKLWPQPTPSQAEKELGALARAPYISETKRIGDKVIKKYSVAGTDLIVYEVYEPSALMGPHGTITSIEGKWYGRVGTRQPPPELEALPTGSEERFRAVGKWYEGQYEEAYKLITEAFPEARDGRHSMGEITLHWKSPESHHSMWLSLEQRKELEKKYGAVAVRWAEEATRPGDIKATERAAEYYYNKVKEVLGLGHLSAELTEEQIMKLREILGLPVDVEEVLRVHRETGYIQ